jgi:hypothetical protein
LLLCFIPGLAPPGNCSNSFKPPVSYSCRIFSFAELDQCKPYLSHISGEELQLFNFSLSSSALMQWLASRPDIERYFQLLICFSDTTPVFILPFCSYSFLFIAYATFPFDALGDSFFPYISPTVLTDPRFQSFIKPIISKYLPVFYYSRACSQTLALFTLLHDFSLASKNNTYSWICLSQHTNTEDILPPKLNYELRRQSKRIAKRGQLKYFTLTRNDPLFESAFQWLIETKNLQYKSTGSRLMTLSSVNYYRALSTRDEAHLSVLMLDQQIISCHLGLRTRLFFVYLLPTYNTLYSSFSIGWLHLKFLIDDLLQSRVPYLDLTIGSESYKQRLPLSTIPIFNHVSFARGYQFIPAMLILFYQMCRSSEHLRKPLLALRLISAHFRR